MAYVSGIANDMTALLTALRNACTANGWTLSGEVLHKGAAFVRTFVFTHSVNVGDLLAIQGGTGIDGGNLLTGAAPSAVAVGVLRNSADTAVFTPFTFPVNYFIHVHANPDEVYLVVEHDGDIYSNLMWGLSPIATQAGGTGLWFRGTAGAAIRGCRGIVSDATGLALGHSFGGVSEFTFTGRLFGNQPHPATNAQNEWLHHAIDQAAGWSTTGAFSPLAIKYLYPLLAFTPSQFNASSPLFPIQAYIARASSKYSLAAEVLHARYVRVDDFDATQVLTLGPDQWRIYPWYKKNLSVRDGSNAAGTNHTGTWGVAVRYDGP